MYFDDLVDRSDFPIPEGAALRPNDDGTVTLITSTGGEHTYDPEQIFRDQSTNESE